MTEWDAEANRMLSLAPSMWSHHSFTDPCPGQCLIDSSKPQLISASAAQEKATSTWNSAGASQYHPTCPVPLEATYGYCWDTEGPLQRPSADGRPQVSNQSQDPAEQWVTTNTCSSSEAVQPLRTLFSTQRHLSEWDNLCIHRWSEWWIEKWKSTVSCVGKLTVQSVPARIFNNQRAVGPLGPCRVTQELHSEGYKLCACCWTEGTESDKATPYKSERSFN